MPKTRVLQLFLDNCTVVPCDNGAALFFDGTAIERNSMSGSVADGA
jgi:hypothetical protein